ncbi:MAG: hypothetical protein ACTSUZ_03270 [Candidatus Thorarchaeota archaeon]
MVTVASITDIDLLDALIQRYVEHQRDEGVTLDTMKKQMQNGLTKETHQVLIEEDSQDVAQGFLVINPNSDRIPIIFAIWNFQSERKLLDYAFEKLSPTCSHISFESGWPTPWLSEDLPIYAQKLGFVKHDRAYIQLHPIDKEIFSKVSLEDDFEFIPFDKSMVEKISKLVFKCVNGTTDQDLFPYVYGLIPKIEDFLNKFLEGSFGKHEPLYSWILREDEQNVGACFWFLMLTLTIDNEGLVGQFSVTHSTLCYMSPPQLQRSSLQLQCPILQNCCMILLDSEFSMMHQLLFGSDR